MTNLQLNKHKNCTSPTSDPSSRLLSRREALEKLVKLFFAVLQLSGLQFLFGGLLSGCSKPKQTASLPNSHPSYTGLRSSKNLRIEGDIFELKGSFSPVETDLTLVIKHEALYEVLFDTVSMLLIECSQLEPTSDRFEVQKFKSKLSSLTRLETVQITQNDIEALSQFFKALELILSTNSGPNTSPYLVSLIKDQDRGSPVLKLQGSWQTEKNYEAPTVRSIYAELSLSTLKELMNVISVSDEQGHTKVSFEEIVEKLTKLADEIQLIQQLCQGPVNPDDLSTLDRGRVGAAIRYIKQEKLKPEVPNLDQITQTLNLHYHLPQNVRENLIRSFFTPE